MRGHEMGDLGLWDGSKLLWYKFGQQNGETGRFQTHVAISLQT